MMFVERCDCTPEDILSPKEARMKSIEDSLEWLRNNDRVVDDVDDPTLKAVSKLAGIPLPILLT